MCAVLFRFLSVLCGWCRQDQASVIIKDKGKQAVVSLIAGLVTVSVRDSMHRLAALLIAFARLNAGV
jgi:hypothetical protein